MVLPPAACLGRIFGRSAIAWGALRGALGLLPGGADLAVRSSLLLIVVAAWLALFFGRRRNEPLFLANLGVRSSVIAGCALLVPVLGEVAVRIVT